MVTSTKNIFVIVVTFNGSRWYERCFGSLFSSSVKLNVVVVDNDSQDDTVNYIRENFPQITLFPQTENLGFGKANNIGIKYALEQDADYLFLLNQDAWVEQDTIEKLLEVFERNPEAGIVAPLQLNGKGDGIDLKFLDIYLSHNNAPFYIDDLYFNRVKTDYQVQLVNAAVWLVSRKCIEKVGGFDTSLYYHYGEDFNYCQRVRYHGFKIFIAPKTLAFHDREDRKGKFTEKFENAWEKIAPLNHFANILLPDVKVEHVLYDCPRKYKRNVIKSILLLKYNRLPALKKQYEEDMKLFNKIQTSREANKKGGTVWL
jgi:GT2 family glycosyltransferase